MAVGMTNIFTTQCSRPSAKKVKIGSQIANIFPVVDEDTNPITTPIVTIQLHRIALVKHTTMPVAPSCLYASVFSVSNSNNFFCDESIKSVSAFGHTDIIHCSEKNTSDKISDEGESPVVKKFFKVWSAGSSQPLVQWQSFR